ncbi:MAG TPA: (p)ppGpp synthetase [Clostridiales bacterium UBA9857]|nr:bifunctional (p)ppGpp synthetase/guanosine-3',5'-bis(diphosphate) 3'-pyrophosphohydrolase [Candidatus Fermentithermobacillaceae bacterium]HAF67232.1 (p)ppGpp synthetase [Clostridiales bacterium UBA9857]
MAVTKLQDDIGAYLQDQEKELVQRAYVFAAKAHEGQYRLSGEEYIHHPVAVARILSELEGDADTLAAALLHDVVEDTDVTLEEIRQEFGPEIARLVDGVTKLSRIQFHSRVEEQVSNLRKMFLAMAEDWRVVVIRLADRLHNLRTLGALPVEKQKQTAEETLDIYAPLAHRLGIWRFKWELEDLSFRYLYPEDYRSLAEQISAKRSEREAEVAMVISRLQASLQEHGIQAEVQGRAKNLYSIYRKMKRQAIDISQIYDLLAVRVIVATVSDCYEVLGLAHTLWKPMPGRFKDYIAMPKPNGYQSLHTTVLGPLGKPFEIQIRTRDMDRTAEYGSAAHWKYKEGKADQSFDQKMSWLRQLLDWQREMTDAGEFMEALKLDLFNDEVFVFTPKGDVIDLPVGSTPLDFAYRIHTDVGHQCVGAKVNGRLVPLSYKLNTGDIVEILTSRQSSGPSRDWLDIVKTSTARSKIRAYFRKLLREEDIARGKAALENEVQQKLGVKLADLIEAGVASNVLKKLNYHDFQSLYAAISYGGISAVHVTTRLREEALKAAPDLLPKREETPKAAPKKPRGPEEAVIVKGMDGILVRLAQCCSPLPGDQIIGYITRGRGVTIHRLDCPTLLSLTDTERFIEATWKAEVRASYPVEILVEGEDRPGLFAEVTSVIASMGSNITNATARGCPDGTARITIQFETHDLNELRKVVAGIRQVEGIAAVKRVFGKGR